jgi:hypothetical protein
VIRDVNDSIFFVEDKKGGNDEAEQGKDQLAGKEYDGHYHQEREERNDIYGAEKIEQQYDR